MTGNGACSRPDWHPVRRAALARVPGWLRPWMRLQASMTQALQRQAAGAVQLQVLAEGRAHLHADEARVLGVRRRHGQVREVLLSVAGRPLVAARSVHVSRRLRAWAPLACLAGRPLGELLFAGGRPAWRLRQCASVHARSSLAPLRRAAGVRDRATCHARRTMFLLARQPLLVTEVFLPALRRLQQGLPPIPPDRERS